jgi:hypothetical protein
MVIQVGLYENPFGFAGSYVADCGKKYGPIGGCQETPVIPVEPDVLDAGDAVEGLAGDGLASSALSCS